MRAKEVRRNKVDHAPNLENCHMFHEILDSSSVEEDFHMIDCYLASDYQTEENVPEVAIARGSRAETKLNNNPLSQ